MKRIFIEEESPQIEVKHEGILEVPEGKNVDDLPMSHFEKLAKKKGLGKITKALNNLQVWNKEKNPELSKWAGNMIDKLNKKLKKDESIESISKNRRTSLNEDVYDVYYDYDYQYGDGEDDWATDTAHETFTGSWDDLQDFIRELKASGYYNIDANARDDVAESCDECCSESLDEGLGMDSIDLGKELYKTAVSTLKSSAHNLSIEDIQNAFDYAMMKVEDKFAKSGI